MIGINRLFDFQDECSSYINEYCKSKNNTGTLILKAPTGAGKTIMLLDFIDKYLSTKTDKFCFVWLTPGSGDLEEQSKSKMNKHLSQYSTKTVDDIMLSGFDDKDVCFINWERVTKKGNKALMDSERKNLYDRINEARNSNLKFIIIVDEEHSNNTKKADDLISYFSAEYKIRVSATTKSNNLYDYYEIPEEEVINSGLITRALYINDGLDVFNVTDENQLLLNLADSKRKIIKEEYSKLNLEINPLVIIQFPNESDDLINLIVDKLEKMNITYDNGKLAIRMSENRINFENIEENSNHVQFLLIKQAIATGWDCPRAKVLVKLRENMNEQFEIQTLGRLRRMPEAKHYDSDILNNAFLYTFDEKYTESVKQGIDNAYFIKRITLKDEHKDFALIKELRNLDYFGNAGERETVQRLCNYFLNKYNLDKNFGLNETKLSTYGYNLSNQIEKTVVKDKVVLTHDMVKEDLNREYAAFDVKTHDNAIELRQSLDSFKKYLNMSYEKTRAVFELMFRGDKKSKYKILNLSLTEFYAFIINNTPKLKEELQIISSGSSYQQELVLEPRYEKFRFPHEDVYKFVYANEVEIFDKNVYNGYGDDCLVEEIKSKSERLFERYCQDSKSVEWFYNNGDNGQSYFSVVYFDGHNKQHLFYPDYILKTKDGKIWIIETKGGENAYGHDKNIDKNVLNKFKAFKDYASKHEGINWGFVRDKNEKLFFNNTEYIDDMNNDQWQILKSIF